MKVEVAIIGYSTCTREAVVNVTIDLCRFCKDSSRLEGTAYVRRRPFSYKLKGMTFGNSFLFPYAFRTIQRMLTDATGPSTKGTPTISRGKNFLPRLGCWADA
jgi:hypothetical protein